MKFILSLAVMAGVAFGADKPLTQRQVQTVKQEFSKSAKKEGWTFSYDVQNLTKPEYAKGYKGFSKKKNFQIKVMAVPGADAPMKSKSLTDFGIPLTPVLNQGSCGSCVIFAVLRSWLDTMLLHGIKTDVLSAQEIMACASEGQCGGNYGEQVAQGLLDLKQIRTWKDYPYTARTSRCQNPPGQKYGKIDSWKTIDGSVRSILAAVHNGQSVPAGVAVDNRWQAYSGGTYNGCSSFSVNHYISINGVDCETSVNADGTCKFDANGNLPAGVGKFHLTNNWGTQWGEDGHMWTKITDTRGRRCNAIAMNRGDAQIFEVGPLKPQEPTQFVLDGKSTNLNVVVKPDAPYSVEQAKAVLGTALTSSEEK